VIVRSLAPVIKSKYRMLSGARICEVEARENPSGLAAPNFSGRIKKPDIRQQF
jgi:hypothetical protein